MPEDTPTAARITSAGNEATPPAAQILITQIGRYTITRLIGEGSMGAVYEAEQARPRRTVALKVIKPRMAIPKLLRRFAQESQALGRLQHPGIAQIYEAQPTQDMDRSRISRWSSSVARTCLSMPKNIG